jgi:hypothetical protein
VLASSLLRCSSGADERLDGVSVPADRFVTTDRLTGDIQWTAPIVRLRDATVNDTSFPDRYFGTQTFNVRVGRDDDAPARRFGPVNDPERLTDAFDLRVPSTDLSTLD